MFEKLMPETVGKSAAELFDASRYHCAEAIVVAYCRAAGLPEESLLPLATPFGGGFGKSFAEACGVISGGLLAIGHCYGRKEPGQNWDVPAELGSLFRQRFIDVHQTSCCRELRERFGEEKQMEECRNLVRFGGEALTQLLQEYTPSPVTCHSDPVPSTGRCSCHDRSN